MKEKVKSLFKGRKRFFIIGGLLLVVGFVVWRSLVDQKKELQFQTTKVERGTVVSTISASGNLNQTNSFTVATQATGVVKTVFVKDSQEVKKGDKLAEITLDQDGEVAKSKAWASYLSAKNTLEIAKVTKETLRADMMEAWEEVMDMAANEPEEEDIDWITVQADFKLAEAKYINQDNVISQNQASLASTLASYQLSSSVITAPQAGRISDISIAPGMILSSGASGDQTSGSQKILAIVSEQQPLISVPVNEIDIGKITAEQKTTLTFDALPDKTFTGKVVGIDRTGSQTQGVVNYPVLIQLDTSYEQLYPNMTATAEIITEVKENVLWVLPQAIRTQAGQTMVRTLINGKPQDKQVEVGLETSDQAEIVSGLSEGETVVVSEITGGGETTFGGGGMRIMGGFGGGPR
jgi:multidrug efflux pump subunit AcrA (membrane-fusion protein)